MGVYIDMEMPKDGCRGCLFVNRTCKGDVCPFLKREVTGNVERGGFQTDCPLVHVPPHGRLIDADEISEHKYATIPPYRKEYADGKPKSENEIIAFKFGWNDAIDAIAENAPTIIQASEEEMK